MNRFLKLSLLVVLLLPIGCSTLHSTGNHAKALNTQQTPLLLDNEIKQLLQQEMQAIQSGMMSLIPVIASGDWEQVATIGKQLEGSYILKQKLSIEQRHALHKSLPTGFIKQDQAFHRSAGMLAHAAEMGHADIVNFYFYKLIAACVACHTEYATHRFPNLVAKEG